MSESENLQRGVENPRVVDLIELDAATDEVVLVMLERRDWGSEPDQLRQLEAKVNGYLGYVLDGYLVQDYPQYRGKAVRLQLDCASQPGPGEVGFMMALRNYCDTQELRFAIHARDSVGA